MPSIDDYKLLESESVAELNTLVNSQISEGRQPVGTPMFAPLYDSNNVIVGVKYLQAMTMPASPLTDSVYNLIYAETLEDLRSTVALAVSEGFTPYGSPQVVPLYDYKHLVSKTAYIQAVGANLPGIVYADNPGLVTTPLSTNYLNFNFSGWETLGSGFYVLQNTGVNFVNSPVALAPDDTYLIGAILTQSFLSPTLCSVALQIHNQTQNQYEGSITRAGSSLANAISNGWAELLNNNLVPNDNGVPATDRRFFTVAERTKLGGIEAGAQVNVVDSVNGQTGTVSLTQDNVPDGETYGQYALTERTKLSGIAAGAQVNTVDSVNSKTGEISLTQDDIPDGETYAQFSLTERSKLSGIENNAEVNTVVSVNDKTGTIDLTQDDIPDGTNYVQFSTADRSKLDGVEADAQVNTVTSVNSKTGTAVLDPDDLDDSATTHKFVTQDDRDTWFAKQDALGFTPIDAANKKTDLTSPNNDDVPTTQAVVSALSFKQDALTFDTTPTESSTNPVTSGSVYDTFLTKLNVDPTVVTVAKSGGDYTSLADACDYVAGLSGPTTPYIINGGPGNFAENRKVHVPSYCTMRLAGIDRTLITPTFDNDHVVDGDNFSEIQNCSISGAGAGYFNLNYEDHSFMVAHKVSFGAAANGVRCKSNTTFTDLYLEICDTSYADGHNLHCIDTGGFGALLGNEETFTYDKGGFTGDSVRVEGTGAIMQFVSSYLEGSGAGTGINVLDGGVVRGNVQAKLFGTGIANTGSGAPVSINLVGTTLIENTIDVDIQGASSSFSLSGTANPDTFSAPTLANPNCSWDLVNSAGGGTEITGALKVTQALGTRTEMWELLRNQDIGLCSGGVVTPGTGKAVNVSAPVGYCRNTLDELARYAPNPVTNLSLPTSWTRYYIYVDTNGVITASTAEPAAITTIQLAIAATTDTGILYVSPVVRPATNVSSSFDDIFAEINGSVYVYGSLAVEGTAGKITVSSGKYYIGSNAFILSGGSDITFSEVYQDGSGGWIFNSTDLSQHAYYDDGTGTPHAITIGHYIKGLLLTVGKDAGEKYYLVRSQQEYTTLDLAKAGPLPSVPSFFGGECTRVASIVMLGGTTAIQSIGDERPRPFVQASSTAAVTSHFGLTDLTSGDAGHTQFIMRNGSKAMTGNFDAGGLDVINVGLVDGVDVSTHAARHAPGGADALPTNTPQTIGTSNSEGAGTAFAKDTHVHAHGAQTSDTHHALVVAGTSHGFMSKTDKTKLDSAGDSFTKNVGTTAGSVAAGDDSRIVGALQGGNNLSDITTPATARSNLGLGTSATKDVGTSTGSVAAGDDSRITGAQQTSGKDATGGYAGLTLFKINFKNVANTFTSFFTNTNTAARTYTFQDRNGTIADDTDLAAKQNSLGFTAENSANKDATGGYAGLTLFKINFKNVANTFTSFFTNTNTAARTYTFQDRNGTIADDTDLAAKQNSLGFTAENSANKDVTGGYAGLTLFKINFKNVANTFTSFFTNTNTAARTYTFQDRNGTIADDTDLAAKQNSLGFTAENSANKDATGGYAGLTLFKINFKNVANTFTSFFTNTNTAARTYTFQDRNGTIADDTDLATKQNSLGFTAENSANKDATGGYAGLTLFKINFKNVANTFTSFFTNTNTAARTYTFQDRNGTIADDTDLAAKQNSLGFTAENSANKDATGGYAGLTLFKINFKNVANTFTSFFTNTNTAARTYTFPDTTGTVALLTDIPTVKIGGMKWTKSTATSSVAGSGVSGTDGTFVTIPTSSGQTAAMTGTASGFTVGTTTAALSYNASGFMNINAQLNARGPASSGGRAWAILRINGTEVDRCENMQYASSSSLFTLAYSGTYTSGQTIDVQWTYDGVTKTFNFDNGSISCMYLALNV